MRAIMTRHTIHKILNPILAVLAVNQAVTIILKEKMTGKSFEFYHQTFGIILLVFILLHVISNFNWIMASFFRKTRKKEEF